jgi:hypothetical protein
MNNRESIARQAAKFYMDHCVNGNLKNVIDDVLTLSALNTTWSQIIVSVFAEGYVDYPYHVDYDAIVAEFIFDTETLELLESWEE